MVDSIGGDDSQFVSSTGEGLAAQFDADPASVAAMYDDWVVTRYDADLVEWGYEAPARIVALVVELLDSGDGDGEGSVLDAGCGSGLVGVELNRRGLTGIVGGDFSAASVEVARSRGVYHEVVELDLNAPLAFDDGRFVAVVSVGVFSYLTDSEATIRELLRVVEPGGWVCFTQRTDLWDDRDFSGLLRGLEDEGVCAVNISQPQPNLPGHPEFGDEIRVFDVTLTKPATDGECTSVPGTDVHSRSDRNEHPMRSFGIPDDIQQYVVDHLDADPVAARLGATTRERFGDLAGMNIGEDQGRFMQMLVEMTGARTIVEVGTFTGMSALWLARGLPVDGRLICFDLVDTYVETATDAWTEAGVADRIEMRIGPAADGLAELPLEPHIDLAFVDADKVGYRNYLDLLLPRMTATGAILVDNVLWSGRIIDADATDDSTVALREFNDHVAERDDCDGVILTVGDGVTLIRPSTARAARA
ncbi:methyltransferase domain-containing protein [Ilumatobacter sp.]|uniref:methyltransferase domain-containing protein n=1 Tax=Ilumatobacter sp. TaxID=1967498 RepID=UPI003C5281DD